MCLYTKIFQSKKQLFLHYFFFKIMFGSGFSIFKVEVQELASLDKVFYNMTLVNRYICFITQNCDSKYMVFSKRKV